jgi:hypothetical protein
MPSTLDPDLLIFIRSAMCSAIAVKALLLMREGGDAVWTAGRLVSELKTHPKAVEAMLRRFETAGLVERRDGGWLWRPALPVLEDLSERLARACRRRPDAVDQAITGSFDRQLLGFADAFRLGS